jgi:aryl-alcohol dehydrogenase-like predicted oxidoreductase
LWAGGPTAVPMGVGTWAWGDQRYWGYGRDYTSDDVAEAYRASRAAGLTLFDTAEGYGNGTSEWLLGQLIRDHGDRGKVQVATKFAPVPWRAGRRGPLLKALEASLTRLQLEAVDLYQLHFSLPLVSDRPLLADLASARSQGLIGAIGVSNYGPSRLRSAHRALAEHGLVIATNQVQYSLLSRRVERTGLVDLCQELGTTVIAYSPLAQGLLTGKYSRATPPPGVRRLRYHRALGAIPALVAQLTPIGDEHGRSPGQVALNWLISKGVVPIPGAKTAEQAWRNAEGAGWQLTDDQVATLDRLGDA